MKYIIASIVIAGICLIAIIGCKKSDNTPEYSMTAMIGNTSFSTTNQNIVVKTLSSTNIVLTGTQSDNSIMDFELENYHGIDVYTIGTVSSTIYNGAFYDPKDTMYPNYIYAQAAVYGQVTITAISPKLIGTFSFTCEDSTKITNGMFTVKAP